jgi:hypothetical protein
MSLDIESALREDSNELVRREAALPGLAAA